MKILAAATFIVSLAFPSFAQRNTATVFGTVTDSSGGFVTAARIRIANDDTGQESATVSDAVGNFILPDLAPGRYSLTAAMPGFKQFVRQNLRLDVDQRPQINVVLQVGDVAETVTVSEGALVVDATQANVGGVVSNVFAQELPLNGRQFLQLGLMLPGTSPAAGGQTTARGGGPRNVGVQAAGNRATNNDYLVDGVDSFGFRFKNTSLRPSVASIEEFKILESPYDAQYGTGSGMQVTVITKSGTNAYHGELFEFLRNDLMDARNFFNAKKTPYRQNQFGGASVDRSGRTRHSSLAASKVSARGRVLPFPARFRPARRRRAISVPTRRGYSIRSRGAHSRVILFLIHGSRRSRKSSSPFGRRRTQASRRRISSILAPAASMTTNTCFARTTPSPIGGSFLRGTPSRASTHSRPAPSPDSPGPPR